MNLLRQFFNFLIAQLTWHTLRDVHRDELTRHAHSKWERSIKSTFLLRHSQSSTTSYLVLRAEKLLRRRVNSSHAIEELIALLGTIFCPYCTTHSWTKPK